MATLSINGTTLTVSGINGYHRYAFRVYYTTPTGASSSWRVPDSGTVSANGNTSWSTNITNYVSLTTSGTYSFYVNIWDETDRTNTNTNTVTYYSGSSSTYTHYARCGTGISYYYIGGNYIGSTGAVSFTSSASTLSITNITPASGYTTPYTLWYNYAYNPSAWDAGSKSLYSSSTTIDSDFTRRITISATQSVTYYPYMQYVYVDGSAVTSTNNSTNTSSSVRVSDLAGYQNYIGTYDFSYASANGYNYAANSYISLTAGSTVAISLYFTTKKYAVAPTITSLSSTENTITVGWNKNGGSSGTWQLYYRVYGASTWSLWGNTTGTISTVTGLASDSTYEFYVRNYVSSSDYKDSSSTTCKTQVAKKAVTPTITSFTVTTDSITVFWNKNGGTDGDWRVYYGTSASSLSYYGAYSGTSATITGLQSGTTYYVQIINYVDASRQAGSAVNQTKTATPIPPIAYFSWTSDDYNNIKAGNVFSSFITATGWNNLTAKINECRNRLGQSTLTFIQANSGNPLTAGMYNTVKGYIAGLTSAGSVSADVVTGQEAKATLFANSDIALKEAINRAIASINS